MMDSITPTGRDWGMAGEVESLELIGDLPSSWRIARFGDVLEGGTRNGIYKSKEFHGRGAKIVNMGELFANPRLRNVEMRRVELSETEANKSSLKVGDLLFARRSLTAEGAGKCIIVTEIKEPTTFESSIIRARPNSKAVDSLFLYYLFNSPYGAYVLLTIRRQVAVSGITGTDLVELPIPLPPLPEQRAIASVLGTLDDLIELNRETNEILEEIARALFKSWFVDFDPVRRNKDEGGRMKDDNSTSSSFIPHPSSFDSLFPDHFQDSELGQIPRGWTVGTVGGICENIYSGGTPNTQIAQYWSGGIPWLSSGETRSRFIIETERTITGAGVANSSTRIARPSSTVIASAGQGHTRGQTSMLTFESYINQSVVVLTANHNITSDLFLFFDLDRRYDEFRNLVLPRNLCGFSG